MNMLVAVLVIVILNAIFNMLFMALFTWAMFHDTKVKPNEGKQFESEKQQWSQRKG